MKETRLALSEEILITIEKPARYIGGEVNMSEKYKESTSKQLEKIDEEPINKNITINRTEFKFDDSLKEIDELISNPEKLKNGFNILSSHETQKNFYMNFLKISFDSSLNKNKQRMKLSACCFICFLQKNYDIEGLILDDEKLNIVSFLLDKLDTSDYFLKNFIAKVLGFIGGKEFPNCYESFIKILINKLNNLITKQDENQIDTILRTFISVLKNCDDRCAIITYEVLPVIINVFKSSKNNQKNREKCLILISFLLNKLSYADGNDMDLLSKSLDTNALMENSISLFTSILVSNPKMLLDIKKYTIRILDILVRDMPIYSSKFFNLLIEPTWRLIVLELNLYCNSIVFNKEIEYTEEEEITIEEENHIYEHGYESDDDEETNGMEGLIMELIDFTVDLLKRNSVIDALRPALFTFLLCIKGYLLLPHNSIVLWKDNSNLYISEEYDEENINSVRSKTLGLIREISKEIEDEALINFIRLLIEELTKGINLDSYKEVIKLDDYNLVKPYLEKLNKDPLYIQMRQESNLLILGNISDDLFRLKESQLFTKKETENLMNFLINIIKNVEKENSILIGRTIWCLSKLLCLVRNDIDYLTKIFESVSQTLINPKSDLSIQLVSAQCISIICQRLISQKKEIKSKYITKNYDALILILNKVNEDTRFIPIENLLYLTKLSKENALYIPLHHLTPVLKIYAENFNDNYVGPKILELIKIWCEDKRSAHCLIDKFIPIAIKVFEDFYRNNIGKTDEDFEEVKNTVMTEHSNPDIKTSSDMLPNLIDIITMLIKYCNENKDDTNLIWIALIVKSLCDILLLSNDVTILQHGCSLLRFYIALCKNIILRQNQVPLLLKVIDHYLDMSLLENSMLYLGNVICQFFFHIENKIIPNLLENIVKRIYKAKMPSIVQSLILVYSRFIVKYPIDTLNFLISIQVENRVGLKVLIDKWLLHQPLFRGKYFKNISIKALSVLYSMKNSIVESLMVIGYNPSHSVASVEVNAPCKILSVLIRCLNNEIMQEKIKNKKTNLDDLDNEDDRDNYDDNEDRDENNDDDFKEEDEEKEEKEKKDDGKIDIGDEEFNNIQEEPKDFSSKLSFLNNQGKTGGLNNLEQGSEIYLTEMLGFDYNDLDSDEEENVEDDLVYLTDIESDFVLKDYLMDFFHKFYKTDELYLTECLKLLPKEDQKMFKSFEIIPTNNNADMSTGNSNSSVNNSDTTSKTS